MKQESDPSRVYEVVVNDEEQYSIWPQRRPIPLGWRSSGKVGLKEECLAYIREVWTDMRPRSLRQKMDTNYANTPPA
jgi:MbtH protein